MAHQEFGPKLLERVMDELLGLAEKDRPERMEGRRFVTVIKPVKGAPIKQQEEEKAKPESIDDRKQAIDKNEAKN